MVKAKPCKPKTSPMRSRVRSPRPVGQNRMSRRSPLASPYPFEVTAGGCWRGDFYLFEVDAPAKSTAVVRFHPTDGSITRIANTADEIVIAAVQTAATGR
jgi:hypothetical protein